MEDSRPLELDGSDACCSLPPRTGEKLDDSLANLLQLGSELLQHLGGDSLALTDQAEEDVLGPDVVVAELECLTQAELEHLLCPGGERNVAGRGLLPLADDLDHFLAHGGKIDVQALQRLGGDALTLVEQPEQYVLGTDVVVVEEPRLFLGQNNDPAGPIREPLKQFGLLSLAYATLPPARS